MKPLLAVLTLIPLAIGAASCGSQSDSGSGNALPEGEVAAAAVNGVPIPMSDVQRVAGNFKRQNFEPDETAEGTTREEKIYYTVLNRLVEQEVVLQEADQVGLVVDEAEVDASIAQFQVNAGGREALLAFLDQVGASLEDFRKDMRINLIIQKYIDEVLTTAIEVSDAEIQAYYDENPDQFEPKPEVRARHILFTLNAGAGDLEKAAVRQRAEEVLVRARQGEDFAALAQETSEDKTTSPNGGDLNWFGRGRMVAPFDSAAFALDPGEISGLVLTQFGFHIIKSEEKRMSEAKTLEASRPGIERFLQQTKFQDQYREKVEELRAKATVELNPPTEEILTEIAS